MASTQRRAAALRRQLTEPSSNICSGMVGQHASAYAVRWVPLPPPLPAACPQPTHPGHCPCTCRQLPKFDVTLMEQFLDDQRVLKHEVYELFRQVGAGGCRGTGSSAAGLGLKGVVSCGQWRVQPAACRCGHGVGVQIPNLICC